MTVARLLGREWRFDFLSPSYFAALKARGVSVVVYHDVNTPEVFQECMDAGASALCTDRPALLMKWLEEAKNSAGGHG